MSFLATFLSLFQVVLPLVMQYYSTGEVPPDQVLGAIDSILSPSADNYVVEVVDGDTIKVIIDGETQTVRLLAIDTPETKHPSKESECYGQEASNFLSELLLHQIVELQPDSHQPDRDRYGRLLRYVYTQDGDSVNEILVTQGYARAYTKQKSDQLDYYLELETQAQESQIGLWKACYPKKT